MTKYLKKQGALQSALLVLLMILSLTSFGFMWNDKTVTIAVDGQVQNIKTHLNSPEGIVRNAGFTLDSKDAVVSSTQVVENGTTLTVLRAFPVQVTVDGMTKTVKTVQTSPQGLADELGYQAPNYTPVDNSTTTLTSGSSITIARVTGRAIHHYDQPIAVQVIRQRDDSLPKGVEEVLQQGSEGLETVEEEVLYSDGTAVHKHIMSRKTVSPMVPTVIKEGTREVSVSRGVGRYREVITMEATAYLPTDGGGDGITATGMVARRGIVAVDPNVIPLGTRVFIPGYGEAIAADTGGDIQGNRIDLVMEDYGEAITFGRRSVEVYIL